MPRLADRPRGALHGWRGAAVLVGLAVALSAGALAAVEVAAGWLLRRADTGAATPPARDDFVALAVQNIELGNDLSPVPLATDPVLLWRNEPGAVKSQPVNPRLYGRDDSWTVRMNDQGYRGPPLAPRRAGVYRVLCIGDSITFGFNVDQDDAFPRRLEQLLAARHPGRAFEVINAGVSGWSWAQGVRYLESRGLALEPDAVVMAHGTNDQFYNADMTDLEYLGRGRTVTGRLRARVGTLLQHTNTARWLAARRAPEEPTLTEGCRQQAASGPCKRVSVAEISALVAEAWRRTRAAGVDLIVMNVDFLATRAVQGVRSAVAAEGIPFLDVVERFAALREADERARATRLGLAPPGPMPGPTPGPMSDPPGPDGTRRLLLRVTGMPAGTQASVTGDADLFGGHPFQAPLRDDGTQGDEVAGDGVFSAQVSVSSALSRVVYRFLRDGTPEALGLPPLPSQFGGRIVTLAGDTRGPVAVFGEYFLMAEQTHPNRAGHELIAEALAEMVEALPSFRTFVTQGAS